MRLEFFIVALIIAIPVAKQVKMPKNDENGYVMIRSDLEPAPDFPHSIKSPI